MHTLTETIREEVEASYTIEELENFQTFEEFWDAVDVQNTYEETWEKWKRQGVKRIYKKVFETLKGEKA